MRRISRNQKRILFISGVCLVLFFALWFFSYLPARAKVLGLKLQLSNMQAEVYRIESIVNNDENPAETIKLLYQRYQQLAMKFPEKEEESIRMFSDLARTSDVEFVSIEPRSKVALVGRDKKAVIIDGKQCRCIFVSVVMKASYVNLVKYIDAIRNDLPSFITIERMKIVKDKSEKKQLRIQLDFNFYLLAEAAG